MKKIPVSIYRGGTSRALFFHKKDLPRDIAEQDQIILQAMGSGHPLQINGLGGGNPLTSKCAIIGPPSVSEADLDYTFVYPGVTKLAVDRKGNCGNILSAVGPYSCNEGLINTKGDRVSTVIHNTNTRTLIKATFDVHDGSFYHKGDFSIDGVPGTGSKISLEFLGGQNDPLLPTGHIKESIEMPGHSDEVDISIINAGNLTVFCTMESLGIEGDPIQWEGNDALWQRMEAVRGAVAVHLGMVKNIEEAKIETPAVPKIICVGSPSNYRDLGERQRGKDSHQFLVLMAAMGVMHRSLAITGAVATSAAAVLPGSVVNDLRNGEGPEVVIGHPSGLITVDAELIQEHETWKIKKISLGRTAREIMKGFVLVE